ncbi:glutathione S-transferase [Bradyrhizobium sp. U87765 SZCCT0131]|uniref:glutathione S-transferase family protein n=1 Tax=unclassified Bradyrhizobium TaxID=2631580 RepID=UPI001BA4E2E4|nr:MULTISPECIES: glutathione S-transferase [unclassified Bradyrhizobium]MBR1220555.1 glutathione S-transferase [Bradyrhizobium sp. U87765 SZCCT0131]MBR1262990.1 glutathione S-transferase [Bradyrhizobium sp. U87765 SZCCT0134]MBR1307127.1 glutathione S-transferase [Bradyrhizobium sp. U87765 SZCCT0110]MBR1322985.1 glutathione S-transferase [Bradyrhizobium sp. U87765 SZCCT0109]MBR1346081.1 glutathione S-transferase [Bradyrhizobium sp. U87765 SZCCT0048]
MTTPASETPRIWGRANSVNVQKVMWCCQELGLSVERIDAGMQYGRTQEDGYLAMNPNARVPTLVHGDFVLWESNSIMRYLVLQFAPASPLYPAEPRVRGGLERWLDWSLSTLQPAERPVFWGLVRTAPDKRDMVALQAATDAVAQLWRIVDAHLADRTYLEGEQFTLADITIGAYVRRWFGVEGTHKPTLPHLQRWYDRLTPRSGFQTYVAPPLS